MSPNEIATFEEVWQKIWAFIYKIIAFLSGKSIDKDLDGTTDVSYPNMDGIKPVY